MSAQILYMRDYERAKTEIEPPQQPAKVISFPRRNLLFANPRLPLLPFVLFPPLMLLSWPRA